MTELDDALARLGRDLEAAKRELQQVREAASAEPLRALKHALETLEADTRTQLKHNAALEKKHKALEGEAADLRARLERD